MNIERRLAVITYSLLLAGFLPASCSNSIKKMDKTDADSTISAKPAAKPDPTLVALEQWQAGSEVSAASVDQFGLNRCFVSQEIDDSLFGRIYGKSFKENCTVNRGELRYIKVLHFTPSGKIRIGEMICSKDIAADLLDIFEKLYEARYPIELMVLIDNYDADDEKSMLANNSSAFNFRYIANTRKLSNHSRGRAVDINPLYNPYVRRRAGGLLVSPAEGRPYADRRRAFPMKINHADLCYKLFKEHGFIWGGDWHSLKDYQHFEKP